MRKLLFPVIAVLLLSVFVVSCNNPTDTQSTGDAKVQYAVDSIRLVLQTSLGKYVPSLNVLITTQTEEYFASSYGFQSETVTPNTYFRFASNTKNFTSASILNMQEDGWLDIDDKITDSIPGTNTTYVPSTSQWNIPNKNQISIKNLLQHSAGVYDVSNDTVPGYINGYVLGTLETDPNHQFSANELVGVVSNFNLSYFLPGTNFHYSNTGYNILSEIIARVYTAHSNSERRYSEYLYNYVVGGSSPVPLGIYFPYLATDNQMPTPNIPGRVYNSNGTITSTSVYNKSGNIGEGNGYGTMAMLRSYIRSMMTGTNVLSPSTVEIMKNDLSSGSPNYALGCTLFTNLGYGHTGSTMGYFSCMFYDPITKVSVVGMIPMWDLTNNGANSNAPFYAMLDACWAARKALGYLGKP
jgi:D-alanyl-D-alanine carboxypeptidase